MENELVLIKPDRDMESRIAEYRLEFIANGDKVNGSHGLQHYEDIGQWLDLIAKMENEGNGIVDVPRTTYFSIFKDSGEIVGNIQLRHWIDAELTAAGGHIGYSIRPSMRGKGYGKAQLMLVLEKARKMGIGKVLLTCDKSNPASAGVIIAGGGVLEKEQIADGVLEQFYWIEVK